MPKAIKSRMEPNVINLPNFPSDFIVSIPDIKSKCVNKMINRKIPSTDARIPITNPDKSSNLFIPLPSVKLLNSMMRSQIKLNRYY